MPTHLPRASRSERKAACCHRLPLTAAQGMPVVAEADDAAADLRFAAAAAGGAEAVNLGVARAKGETKEEKKARKEAVKLQVLRCLRTFLVLRARACSLSSSPSILPPISSGQPTARQKSSSKKRALSFISSAPLLPASLSHPMPPCLRYTSETGRRAPVGAKQSILPV